METRYITVELLGSGYAAVCYGLNTVDLPEPFWEPYDSGMQRYQTQEEAEEEAEDWAKSEGFPLAITGAQVSVHRHTYHIFPQTWRQAQRRINAQLG